MPVPGTITKEILKSIKKGAGAATVLRPGEKELLEQEAKAAAKAAVKDAATPPPAAVAPPKVTTPVDVQPKPVSPKAAVKEATAPPPPAPTAPVANAAVTPVPVQKPLMEFVDPPDASILDQQASELTKKPLVDFDVEASHMPNFDTIAEPEDVKATIAAMAERNRVRVDEARRGVIADEQMRKLAEDLNGNVDTLRQVIERETGGAFTPELMMNARLLVNSSAERLRELAGKITSGTATDLDRINFVRQQQLHGAIYDQFMGARAEWGRTGRVLRAPLGASPYQLKRLRDAVDMIGDARSIDEAAQAITLADSTAGISKIARTASDSKLWGSFNEIFVNAILSGPKTFLINGMGNVLFNGMNLYETAAAARLGKYLTGDEHALVGEASAMWHGTISGARDGLRLFSKALKHGKTVDDIIKYGHSGRRSITAENLLPAGWKDTPLGMFVDTLGAVIRAPTERLIAPTDEFFKTVAYRAELERQALVHVQQQLASGAITPDMVEQVAKDFMENAPEAASDAAQQWAEYVTFQALLGPKGRKWEMALRSSPALTPIAPFIRTPVNLFKAGLLERSPIAVFSRQFREDVRAGGRKRDMALARVATGTLTSLVIADQVMQGSVTGGGPQDPAARSLLEATGWQPYSVKYRDPVSGDTKYLSYARMEPLAFVIGAVADAVEIGQYIGSDVEALNEDEESKLTNVAAAVVAGIANNTMSKTFVKGLADMVELFQDPARYVMNWGKGMAVASIPYSSLRRQIGQIQDPYLREAWTLTDKIKQSSGIPGYSEGAPPRRDVFGDPREVKGGWLGAMSPLPITTDKFDPVTEEVVNLMRDTKRVPLTMPTKKVEGLRLTVDEYDELVLYSRSLPTEGGLTFRDALQQAMSTEAYQSASADMRVEIIKDIQHRFDDYGRKKLSQENLAFAARLEQRKLRRMRMLGNGK